MRNPVLSLLEIFGAPREDLDRLHAIVANPGKVVPFADPDDGGMNRNMHRYLLARDLGCDPGPLSPGLREAAKQVYFPELYGGAWTKGKVKDLI